ncbi:ABC transporter ATP-binding protein [Paenibacillus cisolokensis]|jgi:ABC-type molybdenum transport system, ATPase component/photorepair protein PhrA|uniref:ABC transporter ATP-binding protein n=1 Tax=Paenibacillus cisolokensis TaxID=1658519 RepID=A0ABQ4NFI5_9BACL|nr:MULTISPECIES: ABC transporter ATP-binding protein [Paenibacillus]ALS28536.1 molybdenum ABC transporter ATP-binding protein [Paenibacillus sp. 32O-W]GIQ67017.1 ABC transporter ATP-binding protein [Paenibacillus cisolokensis]
MTNVIELNQVTWRRDDKTILEGIDWQVRQGEHWAVLGLNGSGKTTMLNMINGYIWPTTGTVSVLGHPFGTVDLRELRKSIGWVSSSLQERLYGNDRTQYVVISGKHASIGLYEKPTDYDIERAFHLMRRLGCGHLIDRPYQTCSQGEKQKVLIARALMAEPKLLILDEACNGLDFLSREALLSSISELAESPDAPTMLFVTHHIEEIIPEFTRVLLLRRGAVFAQGLSRDVLNSDDLTDFFETPVHVSWRNGRAWLSLK